eukprot:gene10759-3378_t
MFSIPLAFIELALDVVHDLRDETKSQKEIISFKIWEKQMKKLVKETSPKLQSTKTIKHHVFGKGTFMNNSPDTHFLFIGEHKETIILVNRHTLKEKIFVMEEKHQKFNQVLFSTDGQHIITYTNVFNSPEAHVKIFKIMKTTYEMKLQYHFKDVQKVFQIININENIGMIHRNGELNIFDLSGNEVLLKLFYCSFPKLRNIQFYHKSNGMIYLNRSFKPENNQILMPDKARTLENFISTSQSNFEISNNGNYFLKIEKGSLYIHQMFDFKNHLKKFTFLIDIKHANFSTDSNFVWFSILEFIMCYSLISNRLVAYIHFNGSNIKQLIPSPGDELFIVTKKNRVVKFKFNLFQEFKDFKFLTRFNNINFNFK